MKSTCSSNICSILHQLNTKPNTIKFHKIQGTKLKQIKHFLSWNKANIKRSCKSQLYTTNLIFNSVSIQCHSFTVQSCFHKPEKCASFGYNFLAFTRIRLSIGVYSEMGLLKLPLLVLLCWVFSLLSLIALCDDLELTVKFLKASVVIYNYFVLTLILCQI